MIEEKIFKEFNELVLDTSIYIEYFKEEENEIKKILRKFLFNENSSIQLLGHYILKSEIYYILCRFLEKERINSIIKEIDKFIIFIGGEFLFQLAGEIKCKYPIALSDCFSIAIGIIYKCPVIFLKERELTEDRISSINQEFNVKIEIIP